MLAENGPSPPTLGELAQKKWGFLAGKLLSIAFSGQRLEAPRKSTEAGTGWIQGGTLTDSVIPLRDLPCLSYDCHFLSQFFLANRDPYGKIEKSLYGSSEFPINRIFIHLDTKPRRREQYMHSSQWS